MRRFAGGTEFVHPTRRRAAQLGFYIRLRRRTRPPMALGVPAGHRVAESGLTTRKKEQRPLALWVTPSWKSASAERRWATEAASLMVPPPTAAPIRPSPRALEFGGGTGRPLGVSRGRPCVESSSGASPFRRSGRSTSPGGWWISASAAFEPDGQGRVCLLGAILDQALAGGPNSGTPLKRLAKTGRAPARHATEAVLCCFESD